MMNSAILKGKTQLFPFFYDTERDLTSEKCPNKC